MNYLDPNQREHVLEYVTQGIPLEDQKHVTESTKRDTQIAEHVFELMNQDPTIDIRRTIRSMRITNKVQIKRIEAIIEILLENTSTMSRARAQFIVEKESQRMIRMGEQQGDWHAIQAGTKNLIATHQLDQAEQEKDKVKETWLFPTILKPVEIVGKDKHSLTDKQKDEMFAKYGAQRSEAEDALREKVALRIDQYERDAVADAEAMELPTDE